MDMLTAPIECSGDRAHPEEEPLSLEAHPPIPADQRGSLNPKPPLQAGLRGRGCMRTELGLVGTLIGFWEVQHHTPTQQTCWRLGFPTWPLSRSLVPSHMHCARVLGPPIKSTTNCVA